MNRREFLTGIAGILAAGVAPAAIGSNVLMPIRQILMPPSVQVKGFQVEIPLTNDFEGTASWFEKQPGGLWERKTRIITPSEMKIGRVIFTPGTQRRIGT